MVGQADTIQRMELEFPDNKANSINVRDLILLTLGLVNRDLTLNQAYTYTKNLAIRIKTHLEFNLPDYQVYEKLIQKFIKQGKIEKSYSLEYKKYTIKLTDEGEGEYDFKLYSILSEPLSKVFDEFKRLVSYSY